MVASGNATRCLVIIDALEEITHQGGAGILRELLTILFVVRSELKVFPPGTVCCLQDVPLSEASAYIGKYIQASLPRIANSEEKHILLELFIYAATVIKLLKPGLLYVIRNSVS